MYCKNSAPTNSRDRKSIGEPVLEPGGCDRLRNTSCPFAGFLQTANREVFVRTVPEFDGSVSDPFSRNRVCGILIGSVEFDGFYQDRGIVKIACGVALALNQHVYALDLCRREAD